LPQPSQPRCPHHPLLHRRYEMFQPMKPGYEHGHINDIDTDM